MRTLTTAAELGDSFDSLLSEEALRGFVDLLVRFVEAAGAVVIVIGATLAVIRFVRAALVGRRDEEFVRVRLGLGRYLTLGLEFQLAGDVLSTAIAPTFQEIGKLAAIAAIRTALNYFLGKEIAHERAEVENRGPGPHDTGNPYDEHAGHPDDVGHGDQVGRGRRPRGGATRVGRAE